MLVLLDSASRITVCPPLTDGPATASPQPPLSKDEEHILQARARLIAQYVGKPRLNDLVCIFADQVQLIEDALWDLATLRTIELGVGVQLDGIGDIVGQDRNGLPDDDYRPLLRARVRANRSEGTAPDVIAVASAALDDPGVGEIRFDPKFPASFILSITNPIGFDERILNDLIRDATMGGVGHHLVLPLQPAGEAGIFSAAADFPTFKPAQGFDSAATPGTGTGKFSRAMDEGS